MSNQPLSREAQDMLLAMAHVQHDMTRDQCIGAAMLFSALREKGWLPPEAMHYPDFAPSAN